MGHRAVKSAFFQLATHSSSSSNHHNRKLRASSLSSSEVEDVVKKHGLEVGLFKAFKSKKAGMAKDMLRKYGKREALFVFTSHFF